MKDLLLQLLKNLKEKYGSVFTFMEYLDNKYGSAEETELKPLKRFPLFIDDKQYNIDSIRSLSENFSDMSDKILKRARESNSYDTIEKLIVNYQTDLHKFEQANLENGEKTAKKFVKLLKRTIVKMLQINGLSEIFQEYFLKSDISVRNFSAGHHLSDDDICYLDEQSIDAYKVKTDNRNRNYEVIEMMQPIIEIRYLDENEIKQCTIEGQCRFYYYSN